METSQTKTRHIYELFSTHISSDSHSSTFFFLCLKNGEQCCYHQPETLRFPVTDDINGVHAEPCLVFSRLRLNGVDDLLKLAKQFDFNMFHQDEDEDEEEQHSLELLTDNVFSLETADPDAAAGTGVRPDPHAEDDLDFLFDGPTQTLSGGLSRGSSQMKLSSSHGSCSAATNITAPGTLANDAFEDDWDDDLFNDSLVLEMTQNPQVFTAPKYCSTQKPAGPEPAPVHGGVVHGPSAAVKDKMRQSFRLESNPNFSLTRLQTDSWTNGSGTKATQQSRVSSGQGVSIGAGCQQTRRTLNSVKPELQKPAFNQKTAFKSNMAAPAASNLSLSSCHKSPADLQDDDLLSVFSSDPVWDDLVDDDLLCEVCEDLENQIQGLEMVSTKQTAGNQRAALHPANRNLPPCGGSSLAGGSVSSVSAVMQTSTPAFSSRVSRVQGNSCKDQFTFKKPSNPVSMVTSKGKSSFLIPTPHR